MGRMYKIGKGRWDIFPGTLYWKIHDDRITVQARCAFGSFFDHNRRKRPLVK